MHCHSGNGRGACVGDTGGGNSSASNSRSPIASGNGHDTPARVARCKYSRTVVRPIPQLWATARALSFPPQLNRNTSRIFRMDNLSAGIGANDHTRILADHFFHTGAN